MPSMDDLHRLEAKGLARAKIRSKRRRVSAIRSGTIRGSLALFAITWAIIFGQLVTGNDPALSRSHGTASKLIATHKGGYESGSAPVVPGEPESAPEVEVAPEVEPAPEPAPVITAAS
jgi:hypothetical protein